MTQKKTLLSGVQEQIKEAYEFIKSDYNDYLLEKVLRPNQVIEMPLTIEMDNRSVKTFFAYRSQHNNIRGPYKGGLRFHQNVSKDEVMSLSTRMSLKTAVANIPLGGGKGGIIVNPKELSQNELEKLSRKFMQKLYKHIGPNIDIPAPDVNTNGQIMAWMIDEYIKLTGKFELGAITGKPLSIGGSKGRDIATSLGGLFVLEKYLNLNEKKINGLNIAVQGAGNVGLNFAILAKKAGANIVAISDSSGGVYNPKGLNIDDIVARKNTKKRLFDFENGEKITNKELLELNTDILVPSALEKVITSDNANNIKAGLILELANGPIDREADTILNKKDIAVIPDILANAGGVTVSYFEQVQNNINFYRELEEINSKLEKIMKTETENIYKISLENKTSLRNGAYIIALKRILDAMKIRGN